MDGIERKQTTTEIAEIFSRSSWTVKLWADKGCPHTKQGRGKPYLFSDAEVNKWLQENPQQVGKPKGQESAELSAVRIEKESELVRKYKFNNDVAEGLYLLASDVEAGRIQRIQVVKSALSVLAVNLPPRLAGKTEPEMEAVIAKAVEEICNEFSR